MPLSFSNISASFLIFMLLCLVMGEAVKHARKNCRRSEKKARRYAVGK